MLRKYLTAFCLLIASSLQAEITETNEIASIFEHINEQSLVLFNVTGVLYEPSITLCDKQWRDYFDKRVQAIAADQANAERFINRIKNEIVNNIPKKCLEKNTPELIRRLQADGIKVLGITKKNLSNSYSQNFGQITNKHLLSLGIDLEKTLDYLSLKEPNEEDSFTFRYGLIFTNKHPEGPALVEFLKRFEQMPSNIVMVDNSLQSLENVEEALTSQDIPFKGVRYGLGDSSKENFDPILGIIQFFAFQVDSKVMSDEEALTIKTSYCQFDFEGLLDKYIKEALK